MTPDLVTHLDPRSVGMTIQLSKQAADEINRLHRERVATMAAEIEAMKVAIREAYLQLTYASKSNAASVIHIHVHNAADRLHPFIKP